MVKLFELKDPREASKYRDLLVTSIFTINRYPVYPLYLGMTGFLYR
jgi:hypothetical protein